MLPFRQAQKKSLRGISFYFFGRTRVLFFRSLNGCCLFDSQLAPVVTTFRTYSVIFHRRTAVRTSSNSGRYSFVVRPALISSRLGVFVLWICHF